MFFLFAFVMGLSTGATVLIGQAWGAGERQVKLLQARRWRSASFSPCPLRCSAACSAGN